MSSKCHYAALWPTLQTTPPCPPCSEAVTHVWLRYHQGPDKETFGPDIFHCTAHASWIMDHDVAAIRHILLLLPSGPPATDAPAKERLSDMQTGRRVLVVEDELLNRELLVVILESEGYEVLCAETPDAGLALAVRERPDLIVMDIQLPGMNGREVTRRLKADPATAAIPVVALTALVMTGDKAKGLQAGCDAYLTKPFDTPVFLETLRRLLAGPAAERP